MAFSSFFRTEKWAQQFLLARQEGVNDAAPCRQGEMRALHAAGLGSLRDRNAMRFIILTQYYPPETGAPQNRLSDLARRLRSMGHEVTVLTAKPNYPQGRIHPEFRGGLWRQRVADGLRVVHCFVYPSRSKRILSRLLNYFSFVFSAALIGCWTLPRADVLLVESPPLFLGLAAWWLARWKGARIVFNVSDLYPETAIALGYLQRPWLRKLMFGLEAWCYKTAALVTGQTEGIVQSIRQRFPQKPVFLLTNGADMVRFPPPPDAAEPGADAATFVVGYAGVLGHFQGLNVIVEAADLLREDQFLSFVVYGDGPLREDLVTDAARRGLTHIQFPGHCSHGEVLQHMRRWGAGLVPLINTPLMAGALPSKLFEIMACGLPTVLSSPAGEASRLLESADAGIWAPPGDARALAEAIRSLAADRARCAQFGRNGREYVQQHYNRAEIARRFLQELERLLHQAASPGQ
jgi:colanic acid biosynthesis glycosyl transferase WcaI